MRRLAWALVAMLLATGVAEAQKRRRYKRKGRTYRGHTVLEKDLRTDPLPVPSGEIWMYSVNFREEIRIDLFDDNGDVRDEALAKLDHGLRCKRTKEVRAVDPRLAVLLSIIYDHFGKKRMDLVSGFRYQRNEGSRHFHAAAADITIPGVKLRDLHAFVKTLDTGNMGIGLYPRSGFVHIDIRAPGDPPYRWIDRSRPGRGGWRGKRPNRNWRKRPK